MAPENNGAVLTHDPHTIVAYRQNLDGRDPAPARRASASPQGLGRKTGPRLRGDGVRWGSPLALRSLRLRGGCATIDGTDAGARDDV